MLGFGFRVLQGLVPLAVVGQHLLLLHLYPSRFLDHFLLAVDHLAVHQENHIDFDPHVVRCFGSLGIHIRFLDEGCFGFLGNVVLPMVTVAILQLGAVEMFFLKSLQWFLVCAGFDFHPIKL